MREWVDTVVARRLGPLGTRLDTETLVFAALRELTLIGGVAALFLFPPLPEHRLHRAPLLVGFVVYKSLLFAVLVRWADRAREIFLATLGADLALVFLLVWFTGGVGSPFALLFHPLVALNAYYFGAGVGLAAATLAAGLLGVTTWLDPGGMGWGHAAAGWTLLALLGVALGHVASRERRARARAEDLTREVRAATARLARAEQLAAVGRLSAKMAHEVRNPLGAITLHVDLLGDLVRQCPPEAREEAADLLRTVREEVRALAALTEEYLVAARLPSPRREREDLDDLVVELAEFLRPGAERQGARIVVDLDPALPAVRVDRAMMRQAVHNLVRNSLEALPPGGTVTVGTRRDAGAAVVDVTDDGPGVPAPVASRLFEPFFTTKPRGTGLGLPIAQQIARQHGGDVEWTTPTGGGARFSLRIPLEERDGG